MSSSVLPLVVVEEVLPESRRWSEPSTLKCAQDTKSERPRLERLVDEQLDPLWRFLRRLGVPPALVDDAVQESFAVVARNVERIAVGSEKSFLFGTAVRVAKGLARRGAVERARHEAISGREAALGPGPEQLLAQRRAIALLDELLESLAEPYRTVFVLFELEGFTLTEIAELLSIPRGTAASRLRRGRSEFMRGSKRLRARGER